MQKREKKMMVLVYRQIGEVERFALDFLKIYNMAREYRELIGKFTFTRYDQLYFYIDPKQEEHLKSWLATFETIEYEKTIEKVMLIADLTDDWLESKADDVMLEY